MIKKVLGSILLTAGVLLGALLISKGMVFPHLAGSFVLILLGIVHFIGKGKVKANG